ncbi:hypothetical protein GCM10010441_40870 [Kitasatospora paracochleata]
MLAGMLVPRENARFVLNPHPILVLDRPPIHDVLPELRLVDGLMPVVEGWQVVAQLTFCVVDGPGEHGCVVPTVGGADGLDEIGAWCSAVEEAGGAVVVSVDGLADGFDWSELFTGGRARGGFVASAR